jgi:primary-amine oxidase
MGEVLAFRPGQPVERRVRAILLDTATGAAAELDTARDGQPPIMVEELAAVDEIVKGDSGWRAAMARRGITELDLVRPCPLSAGSFGIQGEEGRRLLRVLSFVQHHEKDHPWAHPVDGLVAYVDLSERRVLHLIDQEVLPVRRSRATSTTRPRSARRGPRSSPSTSPSRRARASPSTATR